MNRPPRWLRVALTGIVSLLAGACAASISLLWRIQSALRIGPVDVQGEFVGRAEWRDAQGQLLQVAQYDTGPSLEKVALILARPFDLWGRYEATRSPYRYTLRRHLTDSPMGSLRIQRFERRRIATNMEWTRHARGGWGEGDLALYWSRATFANWYPGDPPPDPDYFVEISPLGVVAQNRAAQLKVCVRGDVRVRILEPGGAPPLLTGRTTAPETMRAVPGVWERERARFVSPATTVCVGDRTYHRLGFGTFALDDADGRPAATVEISPNDP